MYRTRNIDREEGERKGVRKGERMGDSDMKLLPNFKQLGCVIIILITAPRPKEGTWSTQGNSSSYSSSSSAILWLERFC